MDLNKMQIDAELVDVVVRCTNAGLEMAGVKPVAVGVSCMPARAQDLSVVIGLVGQRNGTITLNVSKRATLFLANRFTSGESVEIDEDVFDAIGEITNIIAGRLKAELSGDKYKINNISCPSIVMGGDYRVHHFSGFRTLAVEFELPEISSIFLKDRIFATTVTLSQT